MAVNTVLDLRSYASEDLAFWLLDPRHGCKRIDSIVVFFSEQELGQKMQKNRAGVTVPLGFFMYFCRFVF